MIQADAATNSLIITASEPVYRNLRAVIDQLDARRAQVYIEALIVELSRERRARISASSGRGSVVERRQQRRVRQHELRVGRLEHRRPDGRRQYGRVERVGGSRRPHAALPTGLNVGLLHKFGNFFGLGALAAGALDSPPMRTSSRRLT